MSPVVSAIVFGLAAAAVAGLALALVMRAAGFTRAQAPVFAAFAGGLVVTIAVVHLIPEAVAMAPSAPWLILAGFGAGFIVHNVLGAGAHAPGAPRSGFAAFAPVVAIALHSALDGAVYSVTFAVDPFTGISAATGLLIHEFPEALICFVLLQRAGLSNGPAAILAFTASGLTTFTAAALSAPFAGTLDAETLGLLFALVAGVLLHVGAAHLLHEAGHAGRVKGALAVFAGAGVAAAMTLAHAGGHGHNHAPHGPHRGHDHDHDGTETPREGAGHDGHDHAAMRPDFRPASHDPSGAQPAAEKEPAP